MSTVPLSIRPGEARVQRRARPVHRWWRDAAGLVAWTTVVFVTALWVSDGGVQQLGSPASGLTSAGRLTGLVSAALLLLQVLLMARIPWVERSYGQDALARRHRLAGFTSFVLLCLHVVLISLGNAATRRLRYESWHLLHLHAYLGVGLALPHQLWTGADFTASPTATAFWWSAYATAAAAVLVFRVALPLTRSLRHRLVVDRLVREGNGVVSVHLRGRRLETLPVLAGQFFVWRFRHGTGWTRGKPFSLSATPDGRGLRITARDLGHGQRATRAAPGRDAGVVRKPLRHPHQRGPDQPQDHHARLRDRYHATAGVAGRTALHPRRHRAALPVRRRHGGNVPPRARAPREDARRDRVSWLPAGYVPALNREVLQAQSAQIDTVSGATCTSQGYLQSLQSAIDAAHR